jgi:hypothetical protein
VDLLRKNPAVAIPVVYQRLEQKDAEWWVVWCGAVCFVDWMRSTLLCMVRQSLHPGFAPALRAEGCRVVGGVVVVCVCLLDVLCVFVHGEANFTFRVGVSCEQISEHVFVRVCLCVPT